MKTGSPSMIQAGAAATKRGSSLWICGASRKHDVMLSAAIVVAHPTVPRSPDCSRTATSIAGANLMSRFIA
jgi:hypothetical protein